VKNIFKKILGSNMKNELKEQSIDVSLLKNEFYACIVEALEKFSSSENNKDVYALVFDCDSDIGSISLRYRNKQQFQNEISRYEEYNQKYGWMVYGLHGCEYDPGEFSFIEYKDTTLVKYFKDSYYYYSVGEYYGKGKPMEDIKDNYEDIFWEMIIDVIKRLKHEITQIGILTTEDFIVFYCDHDQTVEDRDKMLRKIVDEETMRKIGM